jgi:hypothetical protein
VAPNTLLYLTLTAATLAEPNYIIRYLTITSTPSGSFDYQYFLGEFVCGTTLILQVSDSRAVEAASAPILGQCPAHTPSLQITGVSNGKIGLAGSGFDIAETVAITITSLTINTNVITGTVAMSDNTGAFSVTVPLGPIGCGEQFVAFAQGSAGSAVLSAPFFYNCLPPQSGEPAHAPPPTNPPAQSAGRSGSPARPPLIRGVRLDVQIAPPAVGYHQTETFLIHTGAPGTVLDVQLSALGLSLARYSVRADAHGEAQVTYRVPMRLASGKRLSVSYRVSYTHGTVHFLHIGSFLIVGS